MSCGRETILISGEGLTATEAFVRDVSLAAPDGTLLRGRWWHRRGARGVLVVSHGFGEHGGYYQQTAEILGPALDLDVVAMDYRGHGKSHGARGVVRQYDDLVDDLRVVLAWVDRQGLDGPRFILGHSNGGQVALRLLLQDPSGIAAVILSNPALKLALPVSPVKRSIGRLLLRFAPGVTLQGEVRPDLLTRDPIVQREHLADPLRHSRMSAPLFFGLIEGGEMLIARAGEIRTPMLVLLGSDDPVIDPAATRVFFDRLASPEKTLLVYPEMLHQPLSELGREKVFADVVQWTTTRI
jgi:alpha-beta hydrolase superfamily lysophospholipase